MHASVFDEIFLAAIAATALKALAWIACLTTLSLIESLAGRFASSSKRAVPRSAAPSRVRPAEAAVLIR